jgi:hypothetical protein
MIIESKADLEIKKIKQEQLVRLSDLDCVYKNKVKEANLQWNLEISKAKSHLEKLKASVLAPVTVSTEKLKRLVDAKYYSIVVMLCLT